MKKKYVVISLICSAISVILLLGLIIGRLRDKAEQISLTVKPIDHINYNNYLDGNQMDYKDDQVAWLSNPMFHSRLIVTSSDGNSTKFSGISAPFQLLDHQIVYIKQDSLVVRDTNSKNERTLAGNVSAFLATPESIFFLCEEKLYRYDLETEQSYSLLENIARFYIHQQRLYVITNNMELMELDDNGTWNRLVSLPEEGSPLTAAPLGSCVVFRQGNELVTIDTSSGKSDSLRMADGEYRNHRMHFICDDHSLFVSFQATSTDGSIVKNIDHNSNGLWKINPQTKEKTKLCEVYFEDLYLFDGNQLFGIKNNDLFQINTDTGMVTKIAG